MSDRTTGAFPDPDELASAYLDGELDQPTRSAVETDPALLARAGELAGVRAVVGGAMADPPPGLEEAALAAALEIHDSLWAERPVPAPARRRWWERLKVAHLGPVLAGASIVAVAAVGVVAVVGPDDDDTGGEVAITATTTPTLAGGSPAPFQATSDAGPFLGSVEDVDDLGPLLRDLPTDPGAADTEAAAEDAADSAASGSGAAVTASGDGSSTESNTSTVPAPDTAPDALAPEPQPPGADATIAAAAAPPVLRAAAPVCAAPEGTTFYGTVDVGGMTAEVFVASARAVALSTDGCTVLVDVPLP